MSDTKSGDDKTLSVTPKKTLTLKRPGTEQGVVRQNFSHGRTKQVQVEIKKRKFSMPGDKPEPAAAFRGKLAQLTRLADLADCFPFGLLAAEAPVASFLALYA